MSGDHTLAYTTNEVLSYLPGGWTLVSEGTWQAQAASWSCEIEDTSGLRWPLQIQASEASQHGRLQALKRAADDLLHQRRR